MNRKIILLPLAAAVLFGLSSCDNDSSSSTNPDGDDTSSVTPAEYDGGISDIETGDVQVSGVVGQIGSKGWVLDDGKASVYVYGSLASEFKVGDHVLVSATCEGYWGLYELKSATVTAAPTTKAAPTLAAPTEITAADIKAAWDITSVAKQTDATWKPTNSKRYKFTGLTAENVSGYAGWSFEGFSNKLVSYYYVPANNVTEANRSTELYVGCKYDVSFYMIGNNSAKNVNMAIFDVTAHYDAVESVTVTGDATVKTGTSVTLTGACLPATADQGLTWTSSDETKATVSYGKVTGVAVGSVTITATSTADSSKKYDFPMTVAEGTSYAKVASASFSKNNNTISSIDDKSSESASYAIYTSSEGVVLKNEKGSSDNFRVWSSSDYSVRLYSGSKNTISCDKDFVRIVLTCDCYDSSEYCNKITTDCLPTGATVESNTTDHTTTITLGETAKSVTLDLKSQIRVKSIELQAAVK